MVVVRCVCVCSKDDLVVRRLMRSDPPRERSRSGGAGEFMTVTPRGVRGEPITQAAALDFTDFVVLYKSFSLRARIDLRELFRTLAITRKSLSDSSLEDPVSPASPPSPLYRPALSKRTLLTRNTSLDLLVFKNNCHKKKIFDAIAVASIVTNCAGLDSSKSQVSRKHYVLTP